MTSQDPLYFEESNGYRVSVHPYYIDEESNPRKNFFYFAYRVTIENVDGAEAHLARRRWIINDGEGRREEIEGPGVVGENPEFARGTSYQYSSACPLPTPTGNMRGTYYLVDKDGQEFPIKIPLFFLKR